MAHMITYRLDIEYDGGGFSGWAAQPGLRTVQGELEAALGTVLGEEPALSVAGRTDAGVHAWGQVASFGGGPPPEDLAQRVNGLTGPEVTLLRAEPVADGFDARRDARSRTYCYRVHARPFSSPFERGRALWWPHRIDPQALTACAEALSGPHDFTAFTPTDTQHQKFRRSILGAKWIAFPPASSFPLGREESMTDAASLPRPGAGGQPQDGCIWEFWVEADAFMHKMVRVLVGTMLEVASGRRELDDFRSLLDGAPRHEAGETAPAHGLYLASVSYDSG